MDGDDTMEDIDQPSSSKKKETQKKNSSDDTKDSSRGDQKKTSKTSMSNQSSFSEKSGHSGDSGLNMPNNREHKEQDELNKDDRDKYEKNDMAKVNEKSKTRKNVSGRVEKHKSAKRRTIRRAPRRKLRARGERKKRDLSVSTIFTRLSSGFGTPGCKYCGHRCCRRRYEYRRANRRQGRRNRRKYGTRNKIVKRTPRVLISVANQAGSRCEMLSPLFIKTNSELTEQEPSGKHYSEISPEMIYQALRRLAMWRHEVETVAIMNYIKWHYPVDPDDHALSIELAEKLRIAAIVGIVTRSGNDGWALPTALQKRTLTKTHVTLFWQAYADTMNPLSKREKDPEPKKKDDESTQYI